MSSIPAFAVRLDAYIRACKVRTLLGFLALLLDVSLALTACLRQAYASAMARTANITLHIRGRWGHQLPSLCAGLRFAAPCHLYQEPFVFSPSETKVYSGTSVGSGKTPSLCLSSLGAKLVPK